MAVEELRLAPRPPPASTGAPLLERRLSLACWRSGGALSTASSFGGAEEDTVEELVEALEAAREAGLEAVEGAAFPTFLRVPFPLRKGDARPLTGRTRFWDAAGALATPAAAAPAAAGAAAAALAAVKVALGHRALAPRPDPALVAAVPALAEGADAWEGVRMVDEGGDGSDGGRAPDEAAALAELAALFEVAAWIAHWAGAAGVPVEAGVA